MTLFEPKTKKNQVFERGSAIIWIFVMVTLFAALGFVVTQGSRSGEGQVTQKQAELAATEILDYASAIKRAVQELQINGCSDTEISFENAVVAGYSNSNAPSDNSCHIFHPSGGGLRYIAPNEEWLDETRSGYAFWKEWFTSSGVWIAGLGVDGSGSQCAGGASDGSCRELMTGIPYLKLDICKAINKKIGWGNDTNGSPIQDSGGSYGAASHNRFAGSYSNGNQMGTAIPASNNYSSVMNGCIEGFTTPTAESYSFFQVLIIR